ncbi:CPBP family intramembrane metalloprotease [Xylanibacillus composti]|uniref:CAAX amino protease n=1 Tax=Xylanibacillus composti TaxID=1572762 RepID=A0A8J4H7C2_9BACL|nr:type II CAAX endopeptidase family protein [Xylanibacillus composti]MDT9725429.1 CPBP family intramembrane metalloprotease [Xylanibacillus composti]GIQ71056.1 CAAX amino protease [Xylanibacillus composti]
MKKFNWKNIKIRKVSIHDIDDRLLLINLYVTQAATFIIGMILIIFQSRNPFSLFAPIHSWSPLIWGAAFAALVLIADLAVTRFVPDDVMDDGGVNDRIFRNRPLWHIAVLSAVVAICEELLFRGAIQHAIGPYWTSILFAAIHVRYLQHWLMTGMVFSISYGLGWIYDQTGTLWTVIFAHFLIDFIMGCIIRYRREEA